MSHCDRILAALRDGEWHTTAALYQELGGMILHSRISDLRHKGHDVQGRHVPGETGAHGYEYRLVPPDRRPLDHPPMVAAAEHLFDLPPVPAAHYDI